MSDNDDKGDGCLGKLLYQLFGAGLLLLLIGCAAPAGAQADVGGAIGAVVPCLMLAMIMIAIAVLIGKAE
jgi:peptidoglycan/LPS O-acetylase OafA/YrhL